MNKILLHTGAIVLIINFTSCATADREKNIAYSEQSTEQAMEPEESADSFIGESANANSDLEDEFMSTALTASGLRAFEARAIEKLNDYADYIEIISNRKYDPSLRAHAMEMAMENFAGSHTISDSVLLGKVSFPVDSLFAGLYAQRFGKLSVKLEDIRVENSLEQTSSGNYKGSLTFRQTIKRDNVPPYSSVKEIEILLLKVEKPFGDEKREVWEVLFGDIR